ncbi:MAG: radical SAM protein, partial [bacterium]|nr:radical SAM protein [bacterium]
MSAVNSNAVRHFSPEGSPFEAIMVDLTHRCNIECANCYLPNRDIPDMDVEKLIDLLQRLPRRTLIRLVGAEPTLRDDLCDIIRITRELGHSVSLISNGLKLARESYVIRLKEAGLSQVCISMNGADDDDIYRKLDNGKYAGVKTRALNNV